MTAQILPLRTDLPRYSFRVELDGARYEFSMEWNDRAGAWFFDLADAEGDLIVTSIRVGVDYPLLDSYTDDRIPPGILLAVDSQKLDLDPGRQDLGDRVQMIYYPIADLSAEVLAIRGK